MAARKSLLGVSLRARVNTGSDPISGNPIIKNRNFSNVRQDVTPDEAYAVLEALMSLQKHSVWEYIQVDTSTLFQSAS